MADTNFEIVVGNSNAAQELMNDLNGSGESALRTRGITSRSDGGEFVINLLIIALNRRFTDNFSKLIYNSIKKYNEPKLILQINGKKLDLRSANLHEIEEFVFNSSSSLPGDPTIDPPKPRPVRRR